METLETNTSNPPFESLACILRRTSTDDRSNCERFKYAITGINGRTHKDGYANLHSDTWL